eukprot:686956-Pelagomonas_calceolata.AAC.1
MLAAQVGMEHDGVCTTSADAVHVHAGKTGGEQDPLMKITTTPSLPASGCSSQTEDQSMPYRFAVQVQEGGDGCACTRAGRLVNLVGAVAALGDFST